MVYKDPARQREYMRDLMRRKRQRVDSNANEEGVIPCVIPPPDIEPHVVIPVIPNQSVDVKHTIPNRWFVAWMSRMHVLNDSYKQLTCFHVWRYKVAEMHDQLFPMSMGDEHMSVCRNGDTGESWLVW